MNRSNLRAFAGFALAPLSAPLLLRAIAIVGDVDTDLHVRAVPIIVAYIWIPLIGVPAYRLLTKHATFRLLHAFGIGGVIGFMVSATIAPSLFFEFVGLGFFAGVTFWLIWYRRPDARART